MSDLPPISNSPIEKSSESPKAEPHNIQYLFAQLQLSKGLACKTQADTYINKLKETQKEQKECAEMIEKARKLQTDKVFSKIPDDLSTYVDSKNISFYKEPTCDSSWEYNVKSLTNYQETLGTSTQTDMVQLQDYMGQYDSFLQGANSSVKELNDTLITILRG